MPTFFDDRYTKWKEPCAARMLVVADDRISFVPGWDFGLFRFLEAITDPAAPVPPALTLAHRGDHYELGDSVTIRQQTYRIKLGFRFERNVNIENYDQIWLFGFEGAPSISAEEIKIITEFMNSGGGMFATGDHSFLGAAMSSALPRIRRMREWERIPMSSTERIDTIVDPGANEIYEFDDQSDDVPMRIYPHYRVRTGGTIVNWEATVHPVLMLPGAPEMRRAYTDFSNDLSVFPDHAHESVCYATDPGYLDDSYNEYGMSFPEWPVSSIDGERFGAELVASAVSGGRAIDAFAAPNKPPVRPQMFGVISAYDGRIAEPYPRNELPPGRILCDSTWHHYVNVNLDGGASGRTGLGTGSGANFVPSPDLQDIYTYYRNAVAWLQPPNRVWCDTFWRLVDARWSSSILEEITNFRRPEPWVPLTGFGKTVVRVLNGAGRPAAAEELLTGLLIADPQSRRFAAVFLDPEVSGAGFDRNELVYGVFGGLMLKLAEIVPTEPKKAAEVLARGAKGAAKEMLGELRALIRTGIEHQLARADKLVATLRDKRFDTK